MKYFLIICIVHTVLSIQAQPKSDKKDRIQAIKVAYITEKINLSSKQSQQFWPLYNEYQNELKQLNQSLRKNQFILEDMTDDELNIFVENKLKTEEQKIALQRTYLQNYKQVLSIRQIVRLYRAETSFKKELLRRAKERRASRD
jgi:hypothetical protein